MQEEKIIIHKMQAKTQLIGVGSGKSGLIDEPHES